MSKRGDWTIQCAGKYRYTSWRRAEHVAKSRNRAHDDAKIEPYKCPHCGGYHIGNSAPPGVPGNYDAPERPDAHRIRREGRIAIRMMLTTEGE